MTITIFAFASHPFPSHVGRPRSKALCVPKGEPKTPSLASCTLIHIHQVFRYPFPLCITLHAMPCHAVLCHAITSMVPMNVFVIVGGLPTAFGHRGGWPNTIWASPSMAQELCCITRQSLSRAKLLKRKRAETEPRRAARRHVTQNVA